jgi:hypothetical protein
MNIPVTENPYAPPIAPCVGEPQAGMLQELKSQSTWRLLGLGIITLGVYHAHYCARQSRIINKYSSSDPIPPAFVTAILVVSYVSLVLLVGYFFVDETHPVAIVSNVSDRVWTIMILVWGFYARNRVNRLSFSTVDDPRRISGVWTFFFSPLHFNYKINVSNQASVDAPAVSQQLMPP